MCNSVQFYHQQESASVKIKNMPRLVDKEQDCGICLEKIYDKDNKVQALYHVCGKFFHQTCIYPWLAIKWSCPHDSTQVNEETLQHCEIDQTGRVARTEGALPEVQQQVRGFALLYWKPTITE